MIYDQNWEKVPMTLNPKLGAVDDCPQPRNLQRMLEVSRVLAADFYYIRVDLYSVGERVLFGELTQVHENGLGAIIPREMDFYWGSLWSGSGVY